ncbi:MAG: aspartate/glutamate racemase family protein, partial [Pseudomonadota bacterium]
RFPRIPGDGGRVDSYGCPARTHVVPGAQVSKIVATAHPPRDVVAAFCTAAQTLEREGAVALTSSCGFLVRIQHEIAAAVSIPVQLSALSLLPDLLAQEGVDCVGVVTAARQALDAHALVAGGVAKDQAERLAIEGLEECAAFAQAILADGQELDQAGVEQGVLAAVARLQHRAPHLKTVVFECTNLPPYAQAVRAKTGLNVVSVLDVGNTLWESATRGKASSVSCDG